MATSLLDRVARVPISLKPTLGVLGRLLVFLAVVLLAPMGVGLYYAEASWWGFGATAMLSGACGAVLWWLNPARSEFGVRDGFVIVATAWFLLSLFGALPFVFTGVLDAYTDAFFETMSGFTTTGATILGGADTPEIEAVPNAFLFWRSLTHWLGGMGIIVLTLAILPFLGVGGMQLFKAEVPGPSADKLTPLVKGTAQRLWMIYVGFTVLEVLLLLPAMSGFDAVNHAFATMATGGFSTENGSVGQYGSAYIEWVITAFMFLAGINFALHYRLLRGNRQALRGNTEFWTYATIIGLATLALSVALYAQTDGADGSLHDAVRTAAFQAVAIVTTTGFGTADYELWPLFASGVIFLLFFVGGMAGSTSGGVKVMRHVVMYRGFIRELKRLVHPHAVIPVRVGEKAVSPDIVTNILAFFVLYLGTVGMGVLLLSLLGIDLVTAITASLSSVGNIGPAFGTLGPTENYAHLPDLAKWLLALLMMIGRLELYTVFVLFVPDFWRR